MSIRTKKLAYAEHNTKPLHPVSQINESEWLNKSERRNEQTWKVPRIETSLINRLNNHTDVAFSALPSERKLIRYVNFADKAFTQTNATVTENGKQSKQWHRLCYTVKLLLCQFPCHLHVVCVWNAKSVFDVVYLRHSLLNYWRMTPEESTFGIRYWFGSNHKSTHFHCSSFFAFLFTLSSSLSSSSSLPSL